MGRRLKPVNVIVQISCRYIDYRSAGMIICYLGLCSLFSRPSLLFASLDWRLYSIPLFDSLYSILSLLSTLYVELGQDGITAEETPTVVYRGGFFSAIHIDTVTVLSGVLLLLRLPTATYYD